MSTQNNTTSRRLTIAPSIGVGKSGPIVAAAMLLPAVLFSVFILAFSVFQGGRRAETDAIRRAHEILEHVEIDLARETQGLEAVATSLTGVEITTPRPPEDRQRLNAQLFPQWVGSIVWSLDGEAMFSSLPWEQLPAIPSAWSARIRGSTGTVIAGVETMEGRPMVFVHQRVPDDPRNLVLTTALKPDMFQRIVMRNLAEGTIVGLLDADGNFIARSLDPERRVGTPATTFVRNAIASGKPDGAYRGRTFEGLDNISAFARSATTGWSIHIAFSDKAVDSSTNLAMLIAGLGGLASLAIGAGLTWLVVRDARRRRRAEIAIEQAQRIESLGRLTGGIAHDFNNLLTVIIGNLERSRAKGASEPSIDTAMIAARRAADLTRSLLAYSRQQVLSPRTVDPNACVHEAVQVVGRTIGEKYKCHAEVDPEVGAISVDPALLVSALVNLAVNARDAMVSGGEIVIRTVRISITARDRAMDMAPGDYVVISVTDNGPGMAPDVANRAFEPFFTTKEIGKGTGLGLSQVKGFVDQSGGAVRLRTAVGQGATVSLFFPQAAGAPEASVEQPLPEANPVRLRVLIVEDDDAVRENAIILLEEMGHRVRACADGAEARRALSEDKFDLLFSDIGLPGEMNGVGLAAFAVEVDPEIMVLLATGYAQEQVRNEASGHLVLMKPYDARQLGQSISEARAKSASRPLVLIVDDEPLIRLWASDVLTEEGYSVREASTLKTARAVLSVEPIAVAIVDINLPDGSGFDLIREMSDTRAKTKFILASGDNLPADGSTHPRLAKPYNAQALLAAVKTALMPE